MAQFTDGTWDVDHLDVVVRGRGIVAQCPLPRDGGLYDCSANARLIGSAPDLYEALTAIVEALEDGDATATNARQIAIHAGRIALAKADGK